MTLRLPKVAKPMVDFAIHVAVGACGFIVVLIAAVAISSFVKVVDGRVPTWVQMATDVAETALFGLDLVLFGIFVLSEAAKLLRDLFSEWSK